MTTGDPAPRIRRLAGPLLQMVAAVGLLAAVTGAVHVALTPVTVTYLLTSLVVVLAPGTGVIYTLAVALGGGWKRGLAAAVGCTLGILPHLAMAILGLSGLMQTSAALFEVVRWLGVAYLVYLGVGLLRSGGALAEVRTAERTDEAVVPYRRIAARGTLINVLNPKLTIFFFAFIPQFLAAPPTLADPALIGLAAIFIAMTFAVFLGYTAGAAALRTQVVTRPRVMRWIERSLGGLLLAFAARLATADGR